MEPGEESYSLDLFLQSTLRVLTVVAHPDDETLWMGGTILMHPSWDFRIASLCRGRDKDRRQRFFDAMMYYGSTGSIGDMDDGPDQYPQSDPLVQNIIRSEVGNTDFDLIVTHSPFGEYTRHLRHEETALAMLHLWRTSEIRAREIWLFAYTDGQKAHYPRAIENSHLFFALSSEIWEKKLRVIQNIYGFAPDSWESLTTPREEGFWRFQRPGELDSWLQLYRSRPALGQANQFEVL